MSTQPLYHKIQSVFKRDPENNHKTFLIGQWSEDSFRYLADNVWVATEKIDGTNTRIHISADPEADGFYIGGRTERADLHPDLASHLHEIGQRADHLAGLTLYGEGYGAGIQKGGGNYRPDKGFILFDVLAVESNMWLQREDVRDIAKQLDIPYAQTAWIGTLNDAVKWFADGRAVPSAELDGEAEGWVLRPEVELRDRRGNRVITKLKVRDFPERNG